MTDKREHLISGNMFKLMLELSIPGIIGMFVISLYSFVDAIFVGRYVSSVALGAVSLAYTFTLINNGIAVLVGIGSASVLSAADVPDVLQTPLSKPGEVTLSETANVSSRKNRSGSYTY